MRGAKKGKETAMSQVKDVGILEITKASTVGPCGSCKTVAALFFAFFHVAGRLYGGAVWGRLGYVSF
jgi:hypothetical protein